MESLCNTYLRLIRCPGIISVEQCRDAYSYCFVNGNFCVWPKVAVRKTLFLNLTKADEASWMQPVILPSSIPLFVIILTRICEVP